MRCRGGTVRIAAALLRSVGRISTIVGSAAWLMVSVLACAVGSTAASAQATSISLSSSLNPSPFGQSVSFTATVTATAGGGMPGGIVTFFDGDNGFGVIPLSGGRAILTTNALTSGTHTIQAVYGGESTTFAPSISSTLTQVVNAGPGAQRTTQDLIRGFLSRRADAIVSSEPSPTTRHDRLTGSLFSSDEGDASTTRRALGGPRGSNPNYGSLTGGAGGQSSTGSDMDQGASDRLRASGFGPGDNGDEGAGRMSFATSLSQIARAASSAEAGDKEARGGQMALGGPSGTNPALARPLPLGDIWVEAQTTRYRDDLGDLRRKGSVDVLYVGADYVVMPAILVGVLVQFDRAREDSTVSGASADGSGWMAGPYVSARLTRNLFFDARAAWGRSENSVTPFGLNQESFSTDRSLASARLTGQWWLGAWRFSPSASLTWYREIQAGFVNAMDLYIPGQTVGLACFAVGPEIGYQFRNADGSTLEPFVGLKGIWDFHRDDAVVVDGVALSSDNIRGRLETGVMLRIPLGFSVRASGAYDGIADKDYHAWQGQLSVHAPLN